METSNEYRAAIESHNVALRAFQKVRDAYRAMKVGDAEFLAARAAKEVADAAFDVAFAAVAA